MTAAFDGFAQAYVQNIPFVKQNRKTIANVVGLLANLLVLLVGLPISGTMQAVVVVSIQVLAAVAAWLVPNAITPQQAQELDEYVGRHRKAG
jgi:hypothetical protein